MNEYTTLSRAAFDQAVNTPMTPEMATQWIVESAHFRTLSDKLCKYYQGTPEEMKKHLRAGFNEHHADAKERDSIRVSINNWFSAPKGIDDRTISRPYAIEMCFILRLPLQKADQFLKDVCGEGLHYRDQHELAAAFAIENGLDYPAFAALDKRISAMPAPDEAPNENSFTPTAAEALRHIGTEEDLLSYIAEHRADLSSFHNTAYAYFTDMIQVLTEEGIDLPIGKLVEENLYRGLVTQKSKKLTALEKSIRTGWPEETQLSKMKTREIDVTRKVLVLLFLASGGGLSLAADEDEFDMDYTEDDDRDFEGIRLELNAMLVECGFAPLDPRQPFDWMVLFGIATGDLFDLDQRMEGVLNSLFGNDLQND